MIFEPLLEMERQVFSSFLQGTFSVSQVHYIIMIFNVYPPLLSSAIAQSNEYLKALCLANLSQYQNDQLLRIRVNFHFDMDMLAYASHNLVFFFIFYRQKSTLDLILNSNATFLLIFKSCELATEVQTPNSTCQTKTNSVNP